LAASTSYKVTIPDGFNTTATLNIVFGNFFNHKLFEPFTFNKLDVCYLMPQYDSYEHKCQIISMPRSSPSAFFVPTDEISPPCVKVVGDRTYGAVSLTSTKGVLRGKMIFD